MELQVGSTYKTRAGDSVKIHAEHDDRFYGYIRNKDGSMKRIASFSSSGCYCKNKQSEFDIIESAP